MPRFEISDNLAEAFDFALTFDEWWAELLANQNSVPVGASRLLHQDVD